MADVRIERAELDSGIAVMYQDCDHYIRMAFDPDQIEEAAAIALLLVRLPRLVGCFALVRVGS